MVVNVEAENEEKHVADEIFIYNSGPFYYSLECEITSCTGMELEIIDGNNSIFIEDLHEVTWSGYLNTNSTVTAKIDSEHSNSYSSSRIGGWLLASTEYFDQPNSVPSPGTDIELPILMPLLHNCFLWNCNDDQINSSIVLFVGGLDNASDKDAIMIEGSAGDVVFLYDFVAPEGANLEIWSRNSLENKLITQYSPVDSKNKIIDYPQDGQLWFRTTPEVGVNYSTYMFKISRDSNNDEAPGGGELSNPWNHGEPLSLNDYTSFRSSISSFDEDGDAVLLDIGEEYTFSITPEFISGICHYEIIFHLEDGSEIIEYISAEPITTEFTTPVGTVAIEVRITSDEAAIWSFIIDPIQPPDAGDFADAQEELPIPTDSNSGKAYLSPNEMYSGHLHSDDNVDIYQIIITDENGSRIFIDGGSQSRVNYQIQALDQSTGVIVNTTDGSTIIISKGIHALRIERLGDQGTIIDYSFEVGYLGPHEPPELENYTDLSYLFTNFYFLIGGVMLSPILLVIFWNRRSIFSGEILPVQVEKHERRRLQRIRERLSLALANDSIDEGAINSALHQLGDCPWKSIISEWGEPTLRHMTEQVEVCVWRIREGTASLLLGIRIGDKDWNLAAMRVHAPEGSLVSISDVSPSRLFQNDEVFLDNMKARSQLFLRITLDGNPSSLGFQLSGLVDNQPLAAVPNRAIDWDAPIE
jgi:hypothetical protein